MMSCGVKKQVSKKTTPCCTKMGMKRGPWTVEEDEILVSFIKKEGEGRWRSLPKRAGLLRCGKSCRLRWSLIAGRIPGRTDNEIKNYWNTHLRKKLLRQGIDPQTHKPLDANNVLKQEEEVSGGQNPLEPISSSHTDDTTINSGDGDSKNSINVFGGENGYEDFGFCYDDKFSSFLNSLINDDGDPFGNIIPISQPLQMDDCKDEIVGASSSSLGHDLQRQEDI
ncbi:unnamed protein product [Arabidopsis arenosa]|uniref:Uncharacterized protein n=1 Tax=Arabidopsis arenosa TaxID=38785 RepID=A0A8S2A0K8_ARAAE|nr:unnamed protein product [Arabidopsis arenosa]